MRNHRRACFGVLVFLLANRASAEACLTLDEAVQQFVSRSESIKVSEAQVDEAEARLQAARAAVMPSVSLGGSAVQQDVPSASGSGVQSPTSFQTGAKLTLSQPLFKGGREYALLRSARVEVEVARARLNDAKIKAAREVAESFFDAQMAAAEVESLAELTKVSMRRHADIKKRVAIGRSRLADSLGAEAQALSAKAQLEAAKVAKAAADRELLSFISADSLSEQSDERIACRPQDKSLKAVRSLAQSVGKSWDEIEKRVLQRPDLVAARLAVKVASEGVSAARAGHMPSIDLSGNYYLKRGDSRFANGKWDMAVNATWPIFSGGSVRAAIREAKSREQQQVERLRLLEREGLNEARDLWQRLGASIAQLNLLKSSANKSEVYFSRVARDEKLGLSSSLETLQALNSSIDARRTLERFQIQQLALEFKLDLVTGSRS